MIYNNITLSRISTQSYEKFISYFRALLKSVTCIKKNTESIDRLLRSKSKKVCNHKMQYILGLKTSFQSTYIIQWRCSCNILAFNKFITTFIRLMLQSKFLNFVILPQWIVDEYFEDFDRMVYWN